MANTYKNIVITPNRSSNTADPKVVYSGGNTTANTDITLNVYPDSNGTLSWEGSAGQLFSITNDLSNNLFGVNDVSGIPSLEVYANGLVSIAPFGGNVVIGNTAEFILSPGTGLHANGSFGTAGQVLHTNGSAVYWAADDNAGGTVTSVASANGIGGGTITTSGTLYAVAGNSTVFVNASGIHVNTAALPADGVTSVASGNGITGGTITSTGTLVAVGGDGLIVNTSGINVLANTGIVANSTGTFVNATYIGTLSANNASFLGGTAAASYQLNSTLSANVATLTANNASFLGGTAAASYQLNSTLGANIASYLPTYTGVVNGSSHTVGTSTIANSTGVYTGVVNGSSHTVGTSFTANSTLTNTVSLVVSTNTATIGTGTYFVSNGNVGIGNSVPVDKLSVAGGAYFNGTVSLGTAITAANATVGGISTRYDFPDTSATPQYVYLGRWSSAPQSGSKLKMSIIASAGYNAAINQNQRSEVFFKLSNASSFQSGSSGNFFGDGTLTKFSSGGQGSSPSAIRVVQIDNNTYDFYGNFSSYSGVNSFYEITISNGVWTHSGTLFGATSPTGNWIDLTNYTLIDTGNYTSYPPTANSGIVSNTSGVFVNANTGIVANSTGTFVNATYIGTLSANNATYLNGQLASYYTNATNITTGTLPYAQIPANIVNTTSSFTLSGNTTLAGTNTTISSNVFANGIISLGTGVAGSAYKKRVIHVGGQGVNNTTYELARISRDTANWSQQHLEITVFNTYYRGGKTKWNISYNQVDSGTLSCEYAVGTFMHKIYLGAEVLVSGNIYYRPIYIDLPQYTVAIIEINYGYVDVTTINNASQIQFVGTYTTNASATGYHSGDINLNVNGGNTGIGNTAPNAKLQVTGTANISGNVAIAGITTLSTNVVLGTTTITANGGVGTAGQVLTSGAAGNVYWSTPQIGDITAVTAGNGLTGGGTSGDVTLDVGAANGITVAADTVGVLANSGLLANTTGVHVLANTGIVANSTGTFVNATYIGTLSANNASFLGGTAAASYQLNSTLNANIASYLPTYTGVVNGSSHTVGTSFTANSTLTNTVSLVVSTNTATIGTGTYFVSNGNIGIGTSSPGGKLTVAQPSGTYTSSSPFFSSLYDNTQHFNIYMDGNWNTHLSSIQVSTNQSALAFDTNGSERMRITSTGNVGIATATPDAKLAVTGTANVSGNVTVGNTSFANTFLNSHTGISNPQSLTAGVLQTNASLNTLIVGPYTISSGNSLIVATGSRLVII